MKILAFSLLAAAAAAAVVLPAPPTRRQVLPPVETRAEQARKELAALDAKLEALDLRARAEGGTRRHVLAEILSLRVRKGQADRLLKELEASPSPELEDRLDREIRALKNAYRSAAVRVEAPSIRPEGKPDY